MVIEVLGARVSENRDVEMDSPNPLEVEGMRRALNQTVGDALSQHLAQHPLQVGRFRRCPRGRLSRVRPAVADRADDAGLISRLQEYGFEQVGQGRLPLGSG